MKNETFSPQELPFSKNELSSVAISEVELKENKIQISYQNQNGCLYEGDSLIWLKQLQENSGSVSEFMLIKIAVLNIQI